MRLDELCNNIRNSLLMAGIPEPDTETRVILREIANISPTDLFSHPQKEVDSDIVDEINKIVQRRSTREPLQYILGKWDFMGLSFDVKKGVLIPRPDTEILVECVLKEIHDGMNILDLCTGTGCIAIALMAYSNDCRVTAIDISEAAYETVCVNIHKILSDKTNPDGSSKIDNIKVVLSDLYDCVNDKYDIIVSNPPYINTEVIDTLETEVKDYEPKLALDGGEDGLDLIKRIVSQAGKYLVPGGMLFLEIGYDQGNRVIELMRECGFGEVECIKDYSGLDRVVFGRLPIMC